MLFRLLAIVSAAPAAGVGAKREDDGFDATSLPPSPPRSDHAARLRVTTTPPAMTSTMPATAVSEGTSRSTAAPSSALVTTAR